MVYIPSMSVGYDAISGFSGGLEIPMNLSICVIVSDFAHETKWDAGRMHFK